jgi:acyl-CoA reductase-like NAD-dependent aldehyde dehydrogenase
MQSLKVNNPFTGQTIDELKLADEAGVEQFLSIAHGLFLNRTQWISKNERIAILQRLKRGMQDHYDELVDISIKEGGKPYTDTRIEMDRAILGIQLAIEYLGQSAGKMIPMGRTAGSAHRLAFTVDEPRGVVVSISAFNHPINLTIHQTLTAIAAGCPVIIKPALKTPLSARKICDLILQAGLPEGWCQYLVCSNELTEKLASDPRVAYVSFIGSYKVGWYLRSKLSPGTSIALEHGGVATVLLTENADLTKCIQPLIKGGFYHAGQVCVSVQRIFIHETLAGEFIESFVAGVRQLKTGDPVDPQTDVGPLISTQEVERVQYWVEEAVAKGGKILTGGKPVSKACFEPTVILNPSLDALVSAEEVFGPVVSLYTYTDMEDTLKKINALPFSFQAAIFTEDLDEAMDLGNRIKANTVMINDHTAFRVDWMPFGGSEFSGIGIGGIAYSIKEMTKEKLIVLKSTSLNF